MGEAKQPRWIYRTDHLRIVHYNTVTSSIVLWIIIGVSIKIKENHISYKIS